MLEYGLTSSTVEKAVSSLDGVIDLVCAGVVVHLPQADPNRSMSGSCQLRLRKGSEARRINSPKADERHLVAAVHLDSRGVAHVGVFSIVFPRLL